MSMLRLSFLPVPANNYGGGLLGDDDLDAETASLIATLALEDLEEAMNARKGKARANSQLTDEELAYQLQSQQYQAWLTTTEDQKIAKSIGDALAADAAFLNAFTISEEAAAEDRLAAQRLSRGEPLPPPKTSQTRLEDPAFVMHPDPPKQSPSGLWGRDIWVQEDEAASSDDETVVSDLDQMDLAPRMVARVTSSSSNPFTPAAGPSVSPYKTVHCTICSDSLLHRNALLTPCDHHYCKDCVVELVRHFTRDESLFPLRCCQSPIPISNVVPFISATLNRLFLSKHEEFSVLSKDRIYCVNPTCSTFLGSNQGLTTSAVQCPRCRQSTCPRCKQAAHGEEDCVVNASTIQLRALARQQGWQTCPGCHTLVELQVGCYHMTCRCRTQFCYLCAVPWKNCTCPQWEENRLLATAQQRLENELGARAIRNTAPAVLQRQVEERAEALRHTHDCERHTWRYRQGGGRCEECFFNLPQFLLICRNCSLLVCVRCSRNRL